MDDIKIVDNSKKVLEAFVVKKERGLSAIGMTAEKYAQKYSEPRSSGMLINDIAHKVLGNSVYIGTNKSYAPYVELGTGQYASNGNGRKGWWVYVRGSGGTKTSHGGKSYTFDEAMNILIYLRSKGLDAHITNGIKPRHFLKKAAANHTDEYKKILQASLKA